MNKVMICGKAEGNTFRVCDFISGETGIPLVVVDGSDSGISEDYNTVVLCSGVYGGRIHKNVAHWLEELDAQKIRDKQFYLFLTWLGRGRSDHSAFTEAEALLQSKGGSLEQDYAACYGKNFGLCRTGHPDRADRKKILDWVDGLE